MKYENKIKLETRLETQKRLADLWTKCDTWEEFSLKATCDIPEASERDLRTCRLYWFKKTHPVVYMLLLLGTQVGVGAVSGFAFFCVSGFPQGSVLMGFFGYVVALFVHMFMHWDFMATLAWYDEGRPMEY